MDEANAPQEGMPARKRDIEDTEMDITPMIDITFLLLIFFVVTSKLAEPPAGAKLPPAKYGIAVAAKTAVVLTVMKGEGDTAAIYKGDGKVEANRIGGSSPIDQEEEIVDYVESEMNGPTPKHDVIIMAEKGLKEGEVSRVARAVGRVLEGGVVNVAVLDSQ